MAVVGILRLYSERRARNGFEKKILQKISFKGNFSLPVA
jgi:hypothetical protein